MPPDSRSLTHNDKLDVLIVENDPGMARATYEAFRMAGQDHQVQILPDGDEALAYLRRTAPHASAPHPDLICLDLDLPRTSGLDVLKELKRDPKLRLTPVLVVSGSENPDEVRRAYELHASCFIRKPNDLDQLLRFIQVCFEFWGTFVTLPAKPELLGQPTSS